MADVRTTLTTREVTYTRHDGAVRCEERVNEHYGFVASRIYHLDGPDGTRFMPYYVSTGDEYFYKADGGFALPTIQEARAVLSTY